MNPALQGYTAAVAEAAGPGALGGIATDLEAIEQLVLANAQLRAALTDTTVSGPSRRAVMLELLDGKVSEEARRLAAYASGAVLAPEVPSALGWLAARVRHLTEGLDDEPSLSLMSSHRRVGGYAAAEHEGMSNDELESMEDDLFRFSRIVASTPALRAALTDRDLEAPARQGVVNQLLEGKVPDTTLRLVRYVIAGGRARDFVGTLDYLVEATAKARGWRIARVSAAQPIDDTQRNELSGSLSTLAGGPVELQVEVDESLLSGARIVIGDLQVDATARGRLEALREHLTPAGWEPSGFRRRGRSSTDNTEGAN
ncbi:MAG TPA: F0F1 ATP synthase subunit delta [Acidimicrobiales bacterium]